MKAEECKLTTVFADSYTYEIPRYQRPYSWNETNTYELINDTFEAFENNEKEYFIGSIITIETEKGKKFDIVDGQQRLTTLTILLSKLRDIITKEAVKNELQKRVLPINVFTETPQTPRLLVRQQDQYFFKKYILIGEEIEDKTNLSETQLKFINNSITIENYFKEKDEKVLMQFAHFLLENVFVVFVKTESFQSAYRLFNVLNARGLPLSNADLIKNKVFDLTKDEYSHDTIEDRWNEFEEIISISNLDVFLSHHRTSIKGDKQSQVLHKEYETYLDQYSGSSIEFLDEIIKSSNNYQKILKNEFENHQVRRNINSLKKVSHDEWIPSLLCFMNNKIDGLDLSTFIEYLDKITYQNWIRRLGKTKRNTVYYNVINLINKAATGPEVLRKIKEYRNNDEFKTFISGDLYGTQYATAILLRIEEELQDISVSKTYEGTISIEHILPQNFSHTYWKERFTEEEHKNSIHKIGNLTLLSGRKNSSAQNYDFIKKKEAYDKKNKKVSFDMTKEICGLKDWNKDVFEKRQKELVEIVYNIWSLN